MSVEEVPPRHTGIASWSPARRLALLIAIGIGLHNFAEGLAIGQSAARNDIALAAVLVIGFALHNATEGFGIVAPLAAERDPDGSLYRPSWAFLLALGVIGGGPTFVGMAVGHGFTSEAVSVLFLTLAAGSILYVICQLLGVAARAKQPKILRLRAADRAIRRVPHRRHHHRGWRLTSCLLAARWATLFPVARSAVHG